MLRAILIVLTVLVAAPAMAAPITFTFIGDVFDTPTVRWRVVSERHVHL